MEGDAGQVRVVFLSSSGDVSRSLSFGRQDGNFLTHLPRDDQLGILPLPPPPPSSCAMLTHVYDFQGGR